MILILLIEDRKYLRIIIFYINNNHGLNLLFTNKSLIYTKVIIDPYKNKDFHTIWCHYCGLVSCCSLTHFEVAYWTFKNLSYLI